MHEYLLELGIEAKLLIGGLVGAITGVVGKAGKLISKVSAIAIGAAGAMYVTPLASELLSITNEQSRTGISVLIGYIGIKGFETLLNKKLDSWKS